MIRPHEAIISHTHAAWSPLRIKTPLCVALLLLMGLVFSNPLDEHLAAVKKGLTRVALGEKICPYMPQTDARMLLKEWFGVTVSCTEPTEAMWMQYCQQMYISEGMDCNAVSPKNKDDVMNNMRVCRVTT